MTARIVSLFKGETEVPLPAEEEQRSQIAAGRWREKGGGRTAAWSWEHSRLPARSEDRPRQPREEGGARDAVTALLSRLSQPLGTRRFGSRARSTRSPAERAPLSTRTTDAAEAGPLGTENAPLAGGCPVLPPPAPADAVPSPAPPPPG